MVEKDKEKRNFFEDGESVGEDEDDVVTLYNEATEKEEDFYHLATLEEEGRWFIVMKPVVKLPDIDEDEVLIYEIVEDEDGNDNFAPIEDEKLLQKVFDDFMRQVDAYVANDENAGSCGCGCGECDCKECGSENECKSEKIKPDTAKEVKNGKKK